MPSLKGVTLSVRPRSLSDCRGCLVNNFVYTLETGYTEVRAAELEKLIGDPDHAEGKTVYALPGPEQGVEFIPDPKFLAQLEAEENQEYEAFEAELAEFRRLQEKSRFYVPSRVYVEDMDVAFLKSLKSEGYALPGLTFGKREVEEVEIDETEPQTIIGAMPISAMASTRLADIWAEQFEPNGWCLDLALPALVTAASTLVPKFIPVDGSLLVGDDPMVNLYVALIGPVGSGKSQVAEWATKALGIYKEGRGPHYYEVKSGSAEQLLTNVEKYTRTVFQNSVLITPDEWSHLFAKANIPESSFASVLTTSYYKRRQTFTMARNRELNLNLSLSFIGGIVEEDFDTVFNASTLGGLYDRFLFGRAPDGFKWGYRPYPFEVPELATGPSWAPVSVRQDGSLFEVARGWTKKDSSIGRIAEICIRIATIFASVDGRPVVTGKDLEKLEGLAKYQKDIRQQFQPNAGVNPDAMFANAALSWIERYAKEWTNITKLKNALHAYRKRLGPSVAERALLGLARSGEISLWLNNGSKPLPSDYKGKTPRLGLIKYR